MKLVKLLYVSKPFYFIFFNQIAKVKSKYINVTQNYLRLILVAVAVFPISAGSEISSSIINPAGLLPGKMKLLPSGTICIGEGGWLCGQWGQMGCYFSF